MAILDKHSITIDGRRMSVRDAIAYENTDRPSTALAIKLHNILKYSGLRVKQKQELFSFIGWEFMCILCRTTYPAQEFDNTAFHLWGPGPQVRVMLRSGPCNPCKRDRENHNRVDRRDNEPWKIVLPSECQQRSWGAKRVPLALACTTSRVCKRSRECRNSKRRRLRGYRTEVGSHCRLRLHGIAVERLAATVAIWQ